MTLECWKNITKIKKGTILFNKVKLFIKPYADGKKVIQQPATEKQRT